MMEGEGRDECLGLEMLTKTFMLPSKSPEMMTCPDWGWWGVPATRLMLPSLSLVVDPDMTDLLRSKGVPATDDEVRWGMVAAAPCMAGAHAGRRRHQ